MDSGEGRFEPIEDFQKDIEKLIEKFPKHGGIFKVGELIEIRGSQFRVKSIKPTELRLKLLKR